MKATQLAHFFDSMRLSEICYDVNDMEGSSFESFFGAKGVGAKYERQGTYLTAYVIENSLSQDVFLDAVKKYLGSPTIHKYASPYTSESDELMYIVRILDEEDE